MSYFGFKPKLGTQNRTLTSILVCIIPWLPVKHTYQVTTRLHTKPDCIKNSRSYNFTVYVCIYMYMFVWYIPYKAILLKSDSDTGVFLLILQNFQEYLLWETPPHNCLFVYITRLISNWRKFWSYKTNWIELNWWQWITKKI